MFDDLEYVIISILHGAAGEAYHRIWTSPATQECREMLYIWADLASWLRSHNTLKLMKALAGEG